LFITIVIPPPTRRRQRRFLREKDRREFWNVIGELDEKKVAIWEGLRRSGNEKMAVKAPK